MEIKGKENRLKREEYQEGLLRTSTCKSPIAAAT
jgi:hypothetical protein